MNYLNKKDQKRFNNLLKTTNIEEINAKPTKEQKRSIIKWLFDFAEKNKESYYPGYEINKLNNIDNCGNFHWFTSDYNLEDQSNKRVLINRIVNSYPETINENWIISGSASEYTDFIIRIFTNEKQNEFTKEFVTLASCFYYYENVNYLLDFDDFLELEKQEIQRVIDEKLLPEFRERLPNLFAEQDPENLELVENYLATKKPEEIIKLIQLAIDYQDLQWDQTYIDIDPIYELPAYWWVHRIKGCDLLTPNFEILPQNICLTCNTKF
jgi:hypothetical protein